MLLVIKDSSEYQSVAFSSYISKFSFYILFEHSMHYSKFKIEIFDR